MNSALMSVKYHCLPQSITKFPRCSGRWFPMFTMKLPMKSAIALQTAGRPEISEPQLVAPWIGCVISLFFYGHVRSARLYGTMLVNHLRNLPGAFISDALNGLEMCANRMRRSVEIRPDHFCFSQLEVNPASTKMSAQFRLQIDPSHPYKWSKHFFLPDFRIRLKKISVKLTF